MLVWRWRFERARGRPMAEAVLSIYQDTERAMSTTLFGEAHRSPGYLLMIFVTMAVG